LELFWDSFGTLLGLAWLSCGSLGPLLGRLGTPLGSLGLLLGALWSHLAASWLSRGTREASGAHLGLILDGFMLEFCVFVGRCLVPIAIFRPLFESFSKVFYESSAVLSLCFKIALARYPHATALSGPYQYRYIYIYIFYPLRGTRRPRGMAEGCIFEGGNAREASATVFLLLLCCHCMCNALGDMCCSMLGFWGQFWRSFRVWRHPRAPKSHPEAPRGPPGVQKVDMGSQKVGKSGQIWAHLGCCF